MATITKWVEAPIDDVWAVIADARSYAQWVVGSHDIRKVDGTWPQVGSTFHHTQGHGPVKLRDTTTVLESEPPHRLLLEVRIRPFLTGPVEITLAVDGTGTCISITERAEGGLAGLVPHMITGPLIGLRNAEALRRLAAMAWARAAALGRTPEDAAGATAAKVTPSRRPAASRATASGAGASAPKRPRTARPRKPTAKATSVSAAQSTGAAAVGARRSTQPRGAAETTGAAQVGEVADRDGEPTA